MVSQDTLNDDFSLRPLGSPPGKTQYTSSSDPESTHSAAKMETSNVATGGPDDRDATSRPSKIDPQPFSPSELALSAAQMRLNTLAQLTMLCPYLATAEAQKIADNVAAVFADGATKQEAAMKETLARTSIMVLPAEIRNDICEMALKLHSDDGHGEVWVQVLDYSNRVKSTIESDEGKSPIESDYSESTIESDYSESEDGEWHSPSDNGPPSEYDDEDNESHHYPPSEYDNESVTHFLHGSPSEYDSESHYGPPSEYDEDDSEWNYQPLTVFGKFAHTPALLQSSHQIREDVFGLYYSNSTFNVKIHKNKNRYKKNKVDKALAWLEKLPLEHRSHIQHFVLDFEEGTETEHIMSMIKEQARKEIETLGKPPRKRRTLGAWIARYLGLAIDGVSESAFVVKFCSVYGDRYLPGQELSITVAREAVFCPLCFDERKGRLCSARLVSRVCKCKPGGRYGRDWGYYVEERSRSF